ncbi:hypothetical protein GCK72_000169 [Caenorhabditis remanei]|uniref:Uncharacterized protein n=1 Tax=Caenorhabditis remanei TaxID=31234 RepID=A0A6A5HPX3_CAERE|nr:hypothetical protein GCK72_000169 [Caenorhabditis remanei]KAF1768357.1 hypothetical protein GCK72_000169 [Caenorhabditis remanei]
MEASFGNELAFHAINVKISGAGLPAIAASNSPTKMKSYTESWHARRHRSWPGVPWRSARAICVVCRRARRALAPDGPLQRDGRRRRRPCGHAPRTPSTRSSTRPIRSENLMLLDLVEEFLQVLLSVDVGLVGVIQSDLQLVDVGLQLLFSSSQLCLALRLSLKGSLDGFECTLMVLSGILELFLLLLNPLLNLRSDLLNLDLESEHLALLGFKRGFCLVERVLELVLFLLQSSDRLVHFLVSSSSLTDLLVDVADLLGVDLVLSSQRLDLLAEVVHRRAEFEDFSRGVSGVSGGRIDLLLNIINLSLPVINNLVECSLLLLQRRNNRQVTIHIRSRVLSLCQQFSLRLLQRDHLILSSTESLLEIHDSVHLLSLQLLQLLGSDQSLALISRLPLRDLRVDTRQLSLDIILSVDLFLQELVALVEFMLQILARRVEFLSLVKLVLGGLLSLNQLRAERCLGSVDGSQVDLQLLDLSCKIRVVIRQTSLGRSELSNLSGLLVNLLLELGDLDLDSLLLLNLGLTLLKSVQGIGKILNLVVVLSADHSHLVFVGHVLLVEVSSELDDLRVLLLVIVLLSLQLLVLLVESLVELVKLTLKLCTGTVSLGSRLSLMLELILDLNDSLRIFLGLTGESVSQSLLILNTDSQSMDISLLLLKRCICLQLDSRELIDRLLSSLELSLDLSLRLLRLRTDSLLSLHSLLHLVQCLLELGTKSVGLSLFCLLGLEIVDELTVVLLQQLLLLVDLSNRLILRVHLVLKGTDLVFLGGFLLERLVQVTVDCFDRLLQVLNFLLGLSTLLLQISILLLVLRKSVVGVVQRFLNFLTGTIESCELLLDSCGSSLSELKSLQQLGSFSGQLGVGVLLDLSSGLCLLGFCLENLLLLGHLCHLLGHLSAFKLWTKFSEQQEPIPGTEDAPRSDVALKNDVGVELLASCSGISGG